jgi:hypothetical protein
MGIVVNLSENIGVCLFYVEPALCRHAFGAAEKAGDCGKRRAGADTFAAHFTAADLTESSGYKIACV